MRGRSADTNRFGRHHTKNQEKQTMTVPFT